MDPALEEALRREPEDRDIEVAALLAPGRAPPEDLRVIASFGDVVTCRVRAGRLRAVRRHPAIRSLKATRALAPTDAEIHLGDPTLVAPAPAGPVAHRGRGLDPVVAVIDFGIDFAHQSLRAEDGATRLLAVWDQRTPRTPDPLAPAPAPYGYGRVFSRARIDEALRTRDPYATLGYHPADAESHVGAHGTCVADLAAGNGRAPGTRRSEAPWSDLVFVHLSSGLIEEPAGDLADSVRFLEALDWARRQCGDRPFVVNASVGRTGGEHAGRSIVDLAVNAFLEESPGRALCSSAGNYFQRAVAAHGIVRPARTETLEWRVGPASAAELEVFYSAHDRFTVELESPDGITLVLPLGADGPVRDAAGEQVGHAYHRALDPIADAHHVDCMLGRRAPPGTWRVRLVGTDVVDGRFHAWIERAGASDGVQSRFIGDHASFRYTLGSLATNDRALICGAFGGAAVAPFSSSGPCRDGKPRPDLVAPGVAVPAARSTPRGAPPGSGGATLMSGTSAAAPHVASTIARLFSEAPRKLNIAETRALVLGTARTIPGGDPMRTGSGLLDTEAAVRAVRLMFREEEDVMYGSSSRSGAPGAAPRRSWTFDAALEAAGEDVSGYEPIAGPGEAPRGGVRAGDVLVRLSPGEPVPPLVCRIGDALRAHDGASLSPRQERAGAGYYAEATPFRPTAWAPRPAPMRLVLDGKGRVGRNQALYRRRPDEPQPRRPRDPEPPPFEPEPLPFPEPPMAFEPEPEPEPAPDPYADPHPEPTRQDGPATGPRARALEPRAPVVTGSDDGEQDAVPAVPEREAPPAQVVLDPDAFVRTPPPELRPTGTRIPRYSRVRVLEVSGRYARVRGEGGTEYGWTALANLGTFFKDAERLRNVPLAPSRPIAVEPGATALRRALVATFNRLGGLMGPVATELGISLASAIAVWRVESGGRSHTPNQAIIRFENHLLFRAWGDGHPVEYDRHFQHGGRAGVAGRAWENHRFRAAAADPFRSFHGNQAAEYEALALATRLAGDDTALQCISIGGPQILVSNYRMIGYRSAREMYDAFQRDERAHVLGFFDFCQYRYGHGSRRGELIGHLARERWEDFARGYNGGGQVAEYAGHIRTAFEEARTMLASRGRDAESLHDLAPFADSELLGIDAAEDQREDGALREYLASLQA